MDRHVDEHDGPQDQHQPFQRQEREGGGGTPTRFRHPGVVEGKTQLFRLLTSSQGAWSLALGRDRLRSSVACCAEERSSALQISQSEVEEFGYSARNELGWLNKHMADVFSENQMYVSDASNVPISH